MWGVTLMRMSLMEQAGWPGMAKEEGTASGTGRTPIDTGGNRSRHEEETRGLRRSSRVKEIGGRMRTTLESAKLSSEEHRKDDRYERLDLAHLEGGLKTRKYDA